jgi:hypothetical protein
MQASWRPRFLLFSYFLCIFEHDYCDCSSWMAGRHDAARPGTNNRRIRAAIPNAVQDGENNTDSAPEQLVFRMDDPVLHVNVPKNLLC